MQRGACRRHMRARKTSTWAPRLGCKRRNVSLYCFRKCVAARWQGGPSMGPFLCIRAQGGGFGFHSSTLNKRGTGRSRGVFFSSCKWRCTNRRDKLRGFLNPRELENFKWHRNRGSRSLITSRNRHERRENPSKYQGNQQKWSRKAENVSPSSVILPQRNIHDAAKTLP
jgi:hypothetical protein